MNPRESLAAYLNAMESRFRWGATARGLAIAALAALTATVCLVVLLNSVEFAAGFVTAARVVLFLSVAVALCFGLAAPLMALNRRRAAHRVEAKFPEFGERLVTFAEKENQAEPDPFLPLLAADALKVTERVESSQIFPTSWIAGFASAALALAGTLAWLIFAGPGYMGYGANLLWAGPPRMDAPEMGLTKGIKITPGNRKVRRKTDQLVSAELVGFHAPLVKMYARYHSGSKWEQAPMLPQGQSNGYEFLFSGLPESVDYYVEAAGAKSKTFTLTAVDLPGVKKMRVTFQYPSWLGLKPVTEEPAGDLRAVEGTEAILSVETDKPLTTGVIVLDDGKKIELKAKEGNWLEARVPIQKDGLYYIAAMDEGQAVRLTDDYFIEARKDAEPTLRVRKPGRDLKVSPIEEVNFEIEATDDYGLQEMSLHYSVNGGDEKVVPLGKGAKEIHGKTLLSLEDFKLVPGDVVSFYATAKDAKHVAQTDMYFLEAQPYEKEYSQSQQGGGGGGGGGEEGGDNKVSERQKEIISATWNQLRNRFATPAQQKENAKFLSDQEAKLSEQAKSLAKRMRSRELTGGNQEFEQFAKNMDEAVKAMGSAVEKLKETKLQPSLPDQQKALQHLMRAEAIFKQIQVAFGSKGGGGGGGGGAGRELESLFDLELDTEKNQFESGQQASAEQKAKEVDEALEKLKQLARKQEELADARQKQPQSFEQRWQQDMLRRQAEELKKQMEQLSRGQPSQQQGSQQSQSSSSSSGQQGQQQGQPGQQGQGGQQGQQGQSGQSGSPQSQQQQQQAGNRNQQQQQQQQQQQPSIRILSYLIQYNNSIYMLLGVSAAQDFDQYYPTFENTMEGFRQLTDPAKINKKPERIRIKTPAKSMTLEQALRSYNMPANRLNEIAILNGMELTDPVPAGMMIKIIAP